MACGARSADQPPGTVSRGSTPAPGTQNQQIAGTREKGWEINGLVFLGYGFPAEAPAMCGTRARCPASGDGKGVSTLSWNPSCGTLSTTSAPHSPHTNAGSTPPPSRICTATTVLSCHRCSGPTREEIQCC